MEEKKELEERLERLIKKRNREIFFAGFISKKTANAISRVRLLISNLKK